jgi:glutamate formiminotransferase
MYAAYNNSAGVVFVNCEVVGLAPVLIKVFKMYFIKNTFQEEAPNLEIAAGQSISV